MRRNIGTIQNLKLIRLICEVLLFVFYEYLLANDDSKQIRLPSYCLQTFLSNLVLKHALIFADA